MLLLVYPDHCLVVRFRFETRETWYVRALSGVDRVDEVIEITRLLANLVWYLPLSVRST